MKGKATEVRDASPRYVPRVEVPVVPEGYKQTEVGVIPEDWGVDQVGNFSEVGRGRVISHREIAKSFNPTYPVYSSQTSSNGVMGYLDTYDFEGEFVTWTTDGANAGTVFHREGRFNCTNVCGTIKTKNRTQGSYPASCQESRPSMCLVILVTRS